MKTYFGLLILISLILPRESYSNEKIAELLKEGGKVIFIRHAIAPGNGDPINFDLFDCSTQRNLNKDGILQSKKIGLFFIKNEIQIDKVFSSEWCRCMYTANIAFNNFEKFSALNSFYDPRFAKNKTKQIKNLKKYINNWNSKKNLVLVTHFVVILEILGIGVSSGELAISDKNFNVLGTLEINN
tara:strand:- start:1114 stop:1668 length:555 start_codon:yes stop_codon:yes gene_type:complete